MKLLRIVIKGEENPNYTITKAFEQAFGEVDTIWWEDYSTSELNHKLIEVISAGQYQAVFMQIQKAGVIYPETAKMMSLRCPVFNWTGDVSTNLTAYTEIADHVTTLFTNTHDVEALKVMGFRSKYLQVGYDHVYYQNQSKQRQRQIVFCGNYYPDAKFPLTEERVQMARRLKQEFGQQFLLFGKGWEKVGIQNDGYLTNQAEADVYNNSLIAINYSHFNYGRYYSDRLLRELACGCYVVSHDFKDWQKEFKNAKADAGISFHATLDGMVIAISEILADETKKENIDGVEWAKENRTWDHFCDNFALIMMDQGVDTKYTERKNMKELTYNATASPEPQLMPYQNLPFNGDYHACQKFIELRDKYGISIAIETGSCLYGTTKWLAANFKNVMTVEVNPEFAAAGRHRISGFQNVHSFIKDSVSFINEDVADFVSSCRIEDNCCIFFLDAHWEQNCPLLDEIKSIAKLAETPEVYVKPPIIVIHDFFTGDTSLGWDEYNGKRFDLYYVQDAIRQVEKAFDCKYITEFNTESAGARRGIAYFIPIDFD